jgi:hypothetical protein
MACSFKEFDRKPKELTAQSKAMRGVLFPDFASQVLVNAVTGQVPTQRFHMSGNPTNRELATYIQINQTKITVTFDRGTPPESV